MVSAELMRFDNLTIHRYLQEVDVASTDANEAFFDLDVGFDAIVLLE